MNPVVFIQRAFPVGGIETLTLRLANRMIELGVPVTITGHVGEMSMQLDPQIDFVPVADHLDLVRRLPGHIACNYPQGEPILVSLHPMSLGVAEAVAAPLLKAGRTLRCFHLVSHSRAFFFGANWPGKSFMYRCFFESAPPDSTYFMNDAALLAHAAYWRRDLSHYPVLRLALGDGERRWQRAHSGELSIVSVGRLVPFKGYNLAAPSIVRRLRDRGLPASWTIWGYGPSEDDIRARIASEGVGEQVTLAGPIAYADMIPEICRHDLFVGMGTAVLEASTAGVPSLCAVEDRIEEGYGFLDETPLDSVGDVVAGVPMRPLEVDIARFAALIPAEREERSSACAASAVARSATPEAMIAAILAAEPWRPTSVDIAIARAGIGLEWLKNNSLDRLRA